MQHAKIATCRHALQIGWKELAAGCHVKFPGEVNGDHLILNQVEIFCACGLVLSNFDLLLSL